MRSPENRRTGTAGPGVIPLGTRTFTWFNAADPGALRDYSTFRSGAVGPTLRLRDVL